MRGIATEQESNTASHILSSVLQTSLDSEWHLQILRFAEKMFMLVRSITFTNLNPSSRFWYIKH